MADRRDSTTWVVLELTRHGEKLVEENSLASELRRALEVDEEWPIFIPARLYEKKGRTVTVHLMEGYAFVASGLDEVRYYRLEHTKLVSQVLSEHRGRSGLRVLSTIEDSRVAELRRQLNEEVASDIVPGMTVLVTDGIYSRLEGTVIDTEGDYAIVRFELRSLKTISKIPKVFLDAV